MKEYSTSGATIKLLMDRNKFKSKDMAEKIGVSKVYFSELLRKDMKVDVFLEMLNILGYEIKIEKATGMGDIRVEEVEQPKPLLVDGEVDLNSDIEGIDFYK